ncbi:MAG: ATP-dependent DNA helicase [Candidatus Nanopelagicales bacterium]
MTGDSREHLEAILGHPLSDAQWDAVTAPAAPGAIVAGAGSGKTTVMSARVLWLVLEGYAEPDQVLGLTFTTKAAGELLGRTRSGLSAAAALGLLSGDAVMSAAYEPSVSTYHSFAANLLTDHGIRLGLEPHSSVLTEGAREALALHVLRSTSLPLAGLGSSPATLLESMLGLDDELAELDIEPQTLLSHSTDLIAALESLPSRQNIGDDMLNAARVRAALCGLVEEFRAVKAERQVVDFADQIRRALELVRTMPDVVAQVRRQFPFVLLDEYQDTSVAQRILMQRLFGDGHPVTSVGDPCQAIYEWRGASVDNIDRFPDHFPVIDGDERRPARRYPLAENRRSAPAILDLANDVAAPLRAVHAGVEPLHAAVDRYGTGTVRCALLPTYRDEIDWVADQVVQLYAAHGTWEGIAILGRKKSMLADIDQELRDRGIPTRVLGIAGLLDVPVVAEVRAILEVLDDPTADAAFLRLLSGPRWRIGPRDLAALGTAAGSDRPAPAADIDEALYRAVLGSDPQERRGLAEVAAEMVRTSDGAELPLSDEATERLRALLREIAFLRRHASDSPAELIGRILRVTGLGIEAAIGPRAADNARALSAFREWAARFAVEGPEAAGLTAFLARVHDAERFDVDVTFDEVASGPAVQLMTVHKAKGLEFPHVIVPGMYDGGFPSDQGRPRWPKNAKAVPWALRDDAPTALRGFPNLVDGPRDKDHKAYIEASKVLEELEERRLAYVALTRAEQTLITSGHWWGPDQKNARGPGDYLQLIYDWCLSSGQQVDVWAQAPGDDETNPLLDERAVAWPVEPDPRRQQARRWAAGAVLAQMVTVADEPPFDDQAIAAEVASWDADMEVLLAEAARQRAPLAVTVPGDLSASAMIRMRRDPDAFALDLARPMPRQPHPAARRGTALHEWIEGQYAVQTLFDLEDLDAADELTADPVLAELKAAFTRSPYATRVPVALEWPFALSIGGHVVRGRIDAVFRDADGRVEVVDWKSGSSRAGLVDLQLAIYRVAWAEQTGAPLDSIDAAFFLVASGEVVRPQRLADRDELARILGGR